MAGARPIIPRPNRPLTPEALGVTPRVAAPPPLAGAPVGELAPDAPEAPPLAPDPGAGALIDAQRQIAAEDPAEAAARVAPPLPGSAAAAVSAVTRPAAPAAPAAPVRRPGSAAAAVGRLGATTRAASAQAGPSELDLQTDIATQERMAGRKTLEAQQAIARAQAIQANAEANRLQVAKREARQRYQDAVAKPLNEGAVSEALGFGGWILALVGGFAGGLAGDPMAMAGLIQRKVSENLRMQREDKNSLLESLKAELGDAAAAEEAARSQLYELAGRTIEAQMGLKAYDQESEAMIRTLAPRLQLAQAQAAKAAQQHLLNTRLEARAKALGAAEGKLMAGGGGQPRGIPGGLNEALRAAGVGESRWFKFAEAKRDYVESMSAVDDFQNTFEALVEDGDTPGYLESLGGAQIPTFLQSTEGKQLRQAALVLFNKAVKDQSGSALSPGEAERVGTQLFGDWSPRAIRQGMQQMRRRIVAGEDALRNTDPESDAVWRHLRGTPAGNQGARGAENLKGYQ